MPKNRGRQGHYRQGPDRKIVEGFLWKTLFFWKGKAYPWHMDRSTTFAWIIIQNRDRTVMAWKNGRGVGGEVEIKKANIGEKIKVIICYR